jgi:peptide/nickel transport system substrate-binding protein
MTFSLTRRHAATLFAGAPLALASGAVFSQDAKTLTIGVASDPVTLDPSLMASFFEVFVQYNLHEPLVHVTPDLKIEPGLASVQMSDNLT